MQIRQEGAGRAGEGYTGASAPPVPAPTWRRRVLVERPAQLAELAVALRRARVLALDAEFAQVRIRAADEPAHRLAVVQLALDDDHTTSYVVDALRLADLSPLQAALEDEAILKLFHGFHADAHVLAARGLVARHTLDLEAVSRSIFGQRESSLRAMLQRACGITMDKSLQRADWSRRPLTSAMVAYAARDAEMTFVLYNWLAANYGWAVELHELPPEEPLPVVAEWLLPYLETSRGRPVEFAVVANGLAHDVAAQARDVGAALAAVSRPWHRVRMVRVLTDLGLTTLWPEVEPLLESPVSEERAVAVRAAGRLRVLSATAAAERLLGDPVREVRQAAQMALEHLTVIERARRTHPVRAPQHSAPEEQGDDGAPWRATLRARFGLPEPPHDEG